MNINKLRKLPGIDKILEHPEIKPLIQRHGRNLIIYAARKCVESARSELQKDKTNISTDQIIEDIKNLISTISNSSLKPVINATGVILHTNLGRAPISKRAINEMSISGCGYNNLEFDLKTAKRGKRIDHISDLLKFLTKAEDAIAVNNNAAAIVLTLNTLAKNKEVIISRSELIEIGGSFRIPEIMETSGAKMVEVGTTNRTRISDYEKAITPNTAIIFKAHRSNYAIKGFTEDAPIDALIKLCRSKKIHFVYDIGSGLLYKPNIFNECLSNEPDVQDTIKRGCDIVTFSCDKLMGGPQAGIIAGRKKLIKAMARSPMMRALRVGKLTLSVLCSTLRSHLTEDSLVKDNFFFNLISRKPEQLKSLAQKLSAQIKKQGINTKIIESEGQCGGGSLPELKLKSFAVCPIFDDDKSKNTKISEIVFQKLLQRDPPVLGVLRKGELIFDVLTLTEDEISTITCHLSAPPYGLGSPVTKL